MERGELAPVRIEHEAAHIRLCNAGRASHQSIPEKGPRVVRGTPQVKRGEGGSDSIAPLNISPFPTSFPMGPATSQMGPITFSMGPYFTKGTRLFPDGTLFG